MKQIEIADQPVLGLLRTVQITGAGIRYRLFRAAVTVAVIAVAVAFLMNILSESLIKRQVARDTRDRIAELRLARGWAGRLTQPGTPADILLTTAAAPLDSPECREAAVFGTLDEDGLSNFHQQACEAASYLRFFRKLGYAQRRNLVHTAVDTGIFDALRAEEGWTRFTEALSDLKSIRFVSTLEDFRNFLSTWPELKQTVGRIREGHRRAIAELARARAGQTVLEAMTGMTGAFGEQVRDAGFELDVTTVAPKLAEQARDILDERRLEKSIEPRPTRQAIARHFNILPGDVLLPMMWDMLRHPEQAAVYLEKMNESNLETKGLDAERLVYLAELEREQRMLAKAERATIGTGGGWLGLGERLGWLLLVSMLVCGIGISNAMLMTVTERFREIATMKCLGALDGFIMVMFVLESCILGVVGGFFGAVLGSFIGLGRMLLLFGRLLFGSVPLASLLEGMALAVLLGVILAAVAAMYPALKAARLAPMEAMRIE